VLTLPEDEKVNVRGFLCRNGIIPGYWYAGRRGAAVMAPTELELKDVAELETVLVDEQEAYEVALFREWMPYNL
jgi:hypothetical protein